jgi:hypothetical protein
MKLRILNRNTVQLIERSAMSTGTGRSLTLFLSKSDREDMRRLSRFANDIRWFGWFRFSDCR